MKTRKSIKKIAAMIVVLALALTALTAGAFADNTRASGSADVYKTASQDAHTAAISLENESDQDVMKFNLALASDTTWGDDLLGSYFIHAYDGHGALDFSVTYHPDTLIQVRFVTRDGTEVTSDPFSLSILSNPESATFVLHGADGEYGIRVH